MADKFDGSITIDTRLDTEGFKRGSDELRRAVGSLTRQINDTGKQLADISKADYFGRPKVAVESFARDIKRASSDLAGLKRLGKAALDGDAGSMTQFDQQAGSALGRLSEMQTRLEEFGSTEYKTPEFAKAEAEYEKAAGKVAELEKALQGAETSFEDMTNAFGSSNEYAELEDRIEVLQMYKKAYDEAMQAGTTRGRAAAAQILMDANVTGSLPDAIAEAQKQMDKMWADFEGSAAYKNAEKEIAKLTDQLAEAKKEAAACKAEMDATVPSFSGAETENYELARDAIRQATEELIAYRRQVAAGTAPTASPEWTAFQERWQNMATLSGMVRDAFTSAFNAISSAARTAGAAIDTGLAHPIQFVDRAMGGLAATAWRVTSSLAQIAGSAVANGLHRIAAAAKTATMNLLGMVKSGVQSGLKKLSKAILNVGKSSKKSNVSMAGSLKTLLKYGLGIRSLYVLFNKLRAAISEGFGKIAQVDSEFNRVMSEFKTALNYLKYSFAAAFAPIAEYVLPVLSRLMTYIAETTNKLGELFAALTGKSTYTRAVPIFEDYAESVKNAGKSAETLAKQEKKAAKEAKKANVTLAGFDDVEILKDNKDDDVEVDDKNPFIPGGGISQSVSEMANKLKDMWKKADFSELGRMLGDKLKAALDNIPWDKIKDTLRRIAKSIATFLNGFLETPGLFSSIGKTIAEAINSVFEFLESFVSNLHWDSLGDAIKDLIIGALSNIDWPLIFKTFKEFGAGVGTALEHALNNPEIWSLIFTTIANGINAVIYGLSEFLHSINWATLGANIAKGLNDGINAIDWAALAKVLADGVNALFDLWYNFVTTFDWYSFGDHVGKALSDAINNIDWYTGGASVAKTIIGLFKALNGFMKAVDWGAMGKAAIDGLAGFFAAFEWDTVGETLSTFIVSLCDALTGAIEAVDWDALPQKIVDAISDFLKGFDWADTAEAVGKLIGAAFEAIVALGGSLWDAMKAFGKNVMEGGYQGIKDALASIGTWIKKNILDPFVAGFKEAFGIHSPSKEMEPLGGYVIDGLLKGIADAMAAIGTWIKENIVDPFVEGVKSMFGLNGEESVLVSIGGQIIDGLKAGVTAAMVGIGDWIKSTIVDPFVDGVSSLFGLNGQESILVSAGKDLVGGLKTGVSGAMGGISKWVGDKIGSPVCDAVTGFFQIGSPSKVFEGYGGYLMSGLKKGVSGSEKEPLGAIKTVQKNMKDVFAAARQLSAWTKAGSDIMEIGLKAGINKMSSTLSSTIKKLEASLRAAVTSRNNDWKTAGSGLMSSTDAGLRSKQQALVSTTGAIVQAMHRAVEQTYGSWQDAGSRLGQGLLQGLSQRRSELVELASSIIRAMLDTINGYGQSMSAAGSGLMTEVRNGMYSVGDSLAAFASDVSARIRDGFAQDWYGVGSNIGTGIYNGLAAAGGNLSVLAQNTAANMLNAAKATLGIASPSKEFAWVGEMIGAGLGQGIADSEGGAIGAVSSLADAVIREAEDAAPQMQVDAAVDGLDGVLATFSDKVVASFGAMVAAMEDIANGSSFVMPAMATGTVAPYAARKAAYQDDATGASALAAMLAAQEGAGRLTRDDLMEVLQTVCRQYLNIDFYIGDEQIARHANAGNAKLGRRYSASAI